MEASESQIGEVIYSPPHATGLCCRIGCLRSVEDGHGEQDFAPESDWRTPVLEGRLDPGHSGKATRDWAVV